MKEIKTEVTNKRRSSNLELYRILCMMMIVAHHYVVNSGLTSADGLLSTDCTSGNSIFLALFGAWGKTGINCFIMITGYFMCTSQITMRKFVRLLGQVYLYRWLLYAILLIAGYESLSPLRLIMIAMPTWGFSDNFTGCFVVFWLTIPFINILIGNMSKRQHELLLLLLLTIYTLLGSVPTFSVTFNYVVWFGVIYLIASYIRLYPRSLYNRKSIWGWITLVSVLFAIFSILILRLKFGVRLSQAYFLVSDSNKLFAVIIAVSSFLWFKNLNIEYSRIINAFGAGTFGVLLIHANSDAMRIWLWRDTIDVIRHYNLPLYELVIYSVGVVLVVYVVCNLIDQIRIATIEKVFMNWYDNKVAMKADLLIDKVTKKQ